MTTSLSFSGAHGEGSLLSRPITWSPGNPSVDDGQRRLCGAVAARLNRGISKDQLTTNVSRLYGWTEQAPQTPNPSATKCRRCEATASSQAMTSDSGDRTPTKTPTRNSQPGAHSSTTPEWPKHRKRSEDVRIAS